MAALEAAGLEVAELMVNRVTTPTAAAGCPVCGARRRAELAAIAAARAAFAGRPLRCCRRAGASRAACRPCARWRERSPTRAAVNTWPRTHRPPPPATAPKATEREAPAVWASRLARPRGAARRAARALRRQGRASARRPARPRRRSPSPAIARAGGCCSSRPTRPTRWATCWRLRSATTSAPCRPGRRTLRRASSTPSAPSTASASATARRPPARSRRSPAAPPGPPSGDAGAPRPGAAGLDRARRGLDALVDAAEAREAAGHRRRHGPDRPRPAAARAPEAGAGLGPRAARPAPQVPRGRAAWRRWPRTLVELSKQLQALPRPAARRAAARFVAVTRPAPSCRGARPSGCSRRSPRLSVAVPALLANAVTPEAARTAGRTGPELRRPCARACRSGTAL